MRVDWLLSHADAIAIVSVIAGLAWRASARISTLEIKLESVQRELVESKDSAQRNFSRIYERLDRKD